MHIEGDWLFLQFRWNEERIALVKQLAYDYGVRGAWDPDKKTWKLPAHAAPAAMQAMPDMGRCELCETALKDHLHKVARARRGSTGTLPQVTLDGRRLYDHQTEAVARMTMDSVVVAHDMGLGKTLSSLMAARHMLDKDAADNVIIIAPANTHVDWYKELDAVGLKDRAWVFSWARIPKAHKDIPDHDYVLIADEAHYAQSFDSLRTQAFMKLAMNYHCMACWCLTGTPMRNGKPVNLYPLLLAVGSPVALNRRRYEKRYCGARATRFTKWDTTGASNLEELRQRTENWVLRKRAEDCLDLPEKVRIVHQCDVSENTKEAYWRVFETVYSKFLENVEIELEMLRDENPDMSDADMAQARKVKLKAKAVAQLNAVRQAASLAKVDEAYSLAADAIEEGRKVLIFAEFQATVNQMTSKFNSDRAIAYHGGLTQKQRDANYESWKAGGVDVFCATPDSGGLGLNLQEASVVIMLDRSYSPGDNQQAEKRAHRIGTHWPVTVYWLQAFPVDMVVDKMLMEKIGNTETVIEGEALSEWEILRELFEETEDFPKG